MMGMGPKCTVSVKLTMQHSSDKKMEVQGVCTSCVCTDEWKNQYI